VYRDIKYFLWSFICCFWVSSVKLPDAKRCVSSFLEEADPGILAMGRIHHLGRWRLPNVKMFCVHLSAKLVCWLTARNVGACVATWMPASDFQNVMLMSYCLQVAKCSKLQLLTASAGRAVRSPSPYSRPIFPRNRQSVMKKQFWEFASMLAKQTRGDITCHNICDPDVPPPSPKLISISIRIRIPTSSLCFVYFVCF